MEERASADALLLLFRFSLDPTHSRCYHSIDPLFLRLAPLPYLEPGLSFTCPALQQGLTYQPAKLLASPEPSQYTSSHRFGGLSGPYPGYHNPASVSNFCFWDVPHRQRLECDESEEVFAGTLNRLVF